MQNRLKSFLWTWLPLLLWLLVLVFESTNMMSSVNTGSILYKLLKAILGPIDHRSFDVIHAVLRKAGHFFGYGILALLFFRAIYRTYAHRRTQATHEPGKSVSESTLSPHPLIRRAAAVATLCTAAVASADEIHQSFIPSRTGAFHDVVLDTVGGIVLLTFALLWVKKPGPESASAGN